MRPYLAVLSDSFHEAMHSRVLWILLGLILLLLLLLAPLTVTYPLTSQISNSDVRDLRQLAQALVAAEAASETDVRRVIWKKLDDELQKNLKKIAEVEDEENRNIGRELRVRSALASALNEIINDDAVFTDAQLSSLELPPEARRLADGPRYDEQQKRLHRLVMETCFPDQFESRTGRSTQIIYLIWPLGDQIPFGQQQVEQAIEFILAQFTNFFLGFIGVFVGILVTASIIPGTFESGSVNLLLSKPISRPLLYLTKVFGGCWFVLVNCILLVVGVYVSLWRSSRRVESPIALVHSAVPVPVFDLLLRLGAGRTDLAQHGGGHRVDDFILAFVHDRGRDARNDHGAGIEPEEIGYRDSHARSAAGADGYGSRAAVGQGGVEMGRSI